MAAGVAAGGRCSAGPQAALRREKSEVHKLVARVAELTGLLASQGVTARCVLAELAGLLASHTWATARCVLAELAGLLASQGVTAR